MAANAFPIVRCGVLALTRGCTPEETMKELDKKPVRHIRAKMWKWRNQRLTFICRDKWLLDLAREDVDETIDYLIVSGVFEQVWRGPQLFIRTDPERIRLRVQLRKIKLRTPLGTLLTPLRALATMIFPMKEILEGQGQQT